MQRFATRLALFYGASFLILGIQLPFLPVWLEGRGFDANEIAIIVALPLIVRVVFTPLMTLLIHRFGGLRQAIVGFSMLAAASMALMLGTHDFMSVLMITLLTALFFSPVLPVTEALAMAGVRRGLGNYGRMRLWGSITFIIANLVGGAYLATVHPEYILWVLIGVFVVSALASLLLVEPPENDEMPPLENKAVSAKTAASLLRYSPLVLLIIAASFVNASHATFYTFGTVHWTSIGIGLGLAGLLWAIGVIAEIVLFSFSNAAIRAFTAVGLIILACVAGIFRWTAFAFDPDLTALVLLQTLHAFTFGAMHLGVVHGITALVPERLAATAQAIHFTITGLAIGLAMYASGPLYAAYGVQSYFAMAGLSACGLVFGILAYFSMRKPNGDPTETSDESVEVAEPLPDPVKG